MLNVASQLHLTKFLTRNVARWQQNHYIYDIINLLIVITHAAI